jgi:hypothetical protein
LGCENPRSSQTGGDQRDRSSTAAKAASFNPQNEIASFQAHQPQKLAISNQRANQKSTRDQPFRHSSRPTNAWLLASPTGSKVDHLLVLE